ncbi:MAP kinase kinase (MEK) [Tritrichomonas musculus]|uniref:mitogen-activated protein kinase kinase n=1 Tax=Tritrichomonas musculus TaxID=1915356 RepID=A0ABR2H750_9EUKA
MKESFTDFQTLFNNSEIRLQNKYLEETLYKFDFFLYGKDIKSEKEISVFSNESQIIVTDKYEGSDQKECFFICFDYHLIHVEDNQNLIDSILSNIFKYEDSERYYLKGSSVSQNASEEEAIFLSEIENFSSYFYINDRKIGSILMKMLRSMSGFLIKKSYKKLRGKYESNNYEDFADEQKKIDLKKEEFLCLRGVGKGSLGSVELIYHIKREELFALKIPNDDTSESKELIERESSKYLKISHPFICHYYGSVLIDHNKCLLLEFIEGKTLDKFDLKSLTFSDKYNICTRMDSYIETCIWITLLLAA